MGNIEGAAPAAVMTPFVTPEIGGISPMAPLEIPTAPQLEGFPLLDNLPNASLERFWQEDRLYQVNNIPFARPTDAKIGSFMKNLVAASALPLKVTALDYEPSPFGYHDVLGSAVIGGENKGLVTFYRDMSKVSAVEQGGVAIHEMEHTLSPFDSTNDDVYGGSLQRQQAALNVWKIARQAETTGVFLNPYHEYNYRLRNSGKLTEQKAEELYLEETHAIAMEMATMNPEALQAIDQKQYDILKALGRQEEFVPLVSIQNPTTGEVHRSYLDQVLMWQMKTDNFSDMKLHFARLRDTLEGQTTPFHEFQPPVFAIPEGRMFIGYVEVVMIPIEDENDRVLSPEEKLRRIRRLPNEISFNYFSSRALLSALVYHSNSLTILSNLLSSDSF